MEDYSLLVSGLEFKVRQLIEKNNTLMTEVQEMRKKVDVLQRDYNITLKKLNETTKALNIIELSDGMIKKAKDPKKLKLMINEHIRNIERCIAYYNGQK